MLGPLRRLRTVSAKVVWIVAIVSGTTVLAVSIAAGIRGYGNLERLMVEAVSSQTLIVAMNSSAPLSFRDSEMAHEALSALRVVADIDGARLVDNQGRVFADFAPAGHPRPAGKVYPPGRWRDGDGYALVVPVEDRAGVHGRLQVHYNGDRLAVQAIALALQSAILSLGAIFLAWLLARQLRPVLTAPVIELQRATRKVRDTADYSVRARRISRDELGDLTDTFNEMLARIQQQDIDLKASRAEAESASRMKDEFLATLSHELRTPMTPIMGWAQILRRIAAGSPQVLQAAEVIERNALAQTRIIDDLLDMSRIVSGKIGMDIVPFEIAPTVGAAVEAVRGVADARGIQIETQVDPGAPTLMGDPHRVQQVLWNLLSNAIKFSGDHARIHVSVQRCGDRVEIAVVDSGEGISAEFLPHVFERFRQADSSVTRHHGGLGLGLAIVQQIVELHGGTVRVASEGAGKGATFTVSLPIARGDTRGGSAPVRRSAAPPEARASALPLDGCRVLVVDDENDARDWIVRVLADAGAEVHSAESASAALEHLARFQPDALLSDIGMPGTDGYALIRQVRALPEDAGGKVPAVALTAFARADDRQRALVAGYQMHIGKPVDEEELIAALVSACRPH
jgi:signal transduction histidine kinase